MVKKIALACALLSCTAATFASTTSTNWYIGLQGGYASTDYDGSSVRSDFFKYPLGINGLQKQSNKDSGAVGRVNLGYQFYKYLAVEAGYSYFEQWKWKNIYGINNVKGDIQQQSGDLVLKPILPLSRSFDLYALGGAAYVHSKATVNSTAKTFGISGETESAFRPTYGLGADWYFQQYWSLNLEWRRIASGSHIEQSDQGLIGIAYHFHNPDDDDF